jgi:hypothetical protein
METKYDGETKYEGENVKSSRDRMGPRGSKVAIFKCLRV